MSSLVGRSRALADGSARTAPTVYFTLGGTEHATVVPPGGDRWDAVAREVARLLGCEARADDAPAYDRGSRNWTLPMVLSGRRWWQASETISVAVRWEDRPAGLGPAGKWRDLRI